MSKSFIDTCHIFKNIKLTDLTNDEQESYIDTNIMKEMCYFDSNDTDNKIPFKTEYENFIEPFDMIMCIEGNRTYACPILVYKYNPEYIKDSNSDINIKISNFTQSKYTNFESLTQLDKIINDYIIINTHIENPILSVPVQVPQLGRINKSKSTSDNISDSVIIDHSNTETEVDNNINSDT
jgi:hypothetical protein